MTWTPRLISLFVGIQLASFITAMIGIPLIAVFACMKLWTTSTGNVSKWKLLDQVYGNRRDGLSGTKNLTPWNAFVWCAIRNSTNNLDEMFKRVGPLTYKTWMMFSKEWYYKFGWESDGYPSISFGSGRGY